MAEQRRAERISVNLRAHYRSDAMALEGRVSDLSRHGMFLHADYLDSLGSPVSVDLEVPGRDLRLRLAGEVVRVDTTPLNAGMAIRFSALDKWVRTELANLVIERTYQAG